MKDVSLRYQSLGVPGFRGGSFVEGSGGRVSLVCNKFSQVYISIKCQASGTGILKIAGEGF